MQQQLCLEIKAQQKIQQEQLRLQQQEDEIFHEMWEADWRVKEEQEAQRLQRQQQANMEQLGCLKSQMEAAEQQRQELIRLKEENSKLMVCPYFYIHTPSLVFSNLNQSFTTHLGRSAQAFPHLSSPLCFPVAAVGDGPATGGARQKAEALGSEGQTAGAGSLHAGEDEASGSRAAGGTEAGHEHPAADAHATHR